MKAFERRSKPIRITIDIVGTVRARLMALMVIAAIPLITLSVLVAWQSYASSGDQARQIVLLAREAAAARHEAALASAEHLVSALAKAARIWSDPPDACTAFLEQIAALERERYARIVAVDANGAPRCSSDDPLTSSYAGAGWFSDLRASGVAIGGRLLPAADLAAGEIIVAAPVMAAPGSQSDFAGALAIFLRLNWFAQAAEVRPGAPDQPVESWLIEPRGRVLPVGAAAAADLPGGSSPTALMAASPAVRFARSAGGELFAYAATDLPDGVRLLAGFRAQDVIGPARRLLILRFAALGAVLLAGIVIVAIGADQAVAEPVKRLTRAVRRWRSDASRGVAFSHNSGRHLPAEIVELSQAFADTAAELADREAQLRAAEGRQNLLMKEIHHRVKNNLQIVASLLNLQANRITLPAARAEFQSARDRVRALATLHRHLYSEGDLHTINMRGFLTELCGQLFQAMGESEGDRIHIDIDAPELTMSTDQATPLSLIVTEAVSNSLKYAFPAGRRGTISVSLKADDGTATLVIQDDGVGIPAGRSETETGTRDGLGLQLMTGFARQLGTELHVEEAPGGLSGTRYSLTISLDHDSAAAAAPA